MVSTEYAVTNQYHPYTLSQVKSVYRVSTTIWLNLIMFEPVSAMGWSSKPHDVHWKLIPWELKMNIYDCLGSCSSVADLYIIVQSSINKV